MAVLSDTERFNVWARSMRENILTETDLLKTDLRDVVNALDDFLNTNATAINNAIPEPARSSLTAKQKAAFLMYVIAKRYEVEV